MTKSGDWIEVGVAVLTIAFGAVLGAAVLTGCDGSGTGGSGGSGGGSGGDGGSGGGSTVVADCEAAAKAAGEKCAAEADRKCFFDEYAKLCATERPEAILDAMKCFTTDVCHTFADPGETTVETCLKVAYGKHETIPSKEAVALYCALCISDPQCPEDGGAGAPLNHFSDALLAEMKACMDTAADCTAAQACVTGELPGVLACF